jgi:hypothetical protein
MDGQTTQCSAMDASFGVALEVLEAIGAGGRHWRGRRWQEVGWSASLWPLSLAERPRVDISSGRQHISDFCFCRDMNPNLHTHNVKSLIDCIQLGKGMNSSKMF